MPVKQQRLRSSLETFLIAAGVNLEDRASILNPHEGCKAPEATSCGDGQRPSGWTDMDKTTFEDLATIITQN